MSYVICSNSTGGGYYVARSYNYGGDKYAARDYIAPLYRDYFGKYTVSCAVEFETVDQARRYLTAHAGLIPDTWHIRKYDPCMNAVLEAVKI